MRIKLIAGIIVLLAAILINACENKQGAIPADALPSNCDTANLSYSSGPNTMQAIINVQCGVGSTSCHSPGSASHYDYSTYGGIYANYQNGDLNGALFGNLTRMPLTPQPGWDPACMLPKFKAWMMNKRCRQ